MAVSIKGGATEHAKSGQNGETHASNSMTLTSEDQASHISIVVVQHLNAPNQAPGHCSEAQPTKLWVNHQSNNLPD